MACREPRGSSGCQVPFCGRRHGTSHKGDGPRVSPRSCSAQCFLQGVGAWRSWCCQLGCVCQSGWAVKCQWFGFAGASACAAQQALVGPRGLTHWERQANVAAVHSLSDSHLHGCPSLRGEHVRGRHTGDPGCAGLRCRMRCGACSELVKQSLVSAPGSSPVAYGVEARPRDGTRSRGRDGATAAPLQRPPRHPPDPLVRAGLPRRGLLNGAAGHAAGGRRCRPQGLPAPAGSPCGPPPVPDGRSRNLFRQLLAALPRSTGQV